MRKILGVCLLVLLLTGSASAGIMQNGVAAQESAQDSTMQNGGADSLTQIALDLLAALPSLL